MRTSDHLAGERMRRKIPSTMALQAFEAAARHQSYTKAADELAGTVNCEAGALPKVYGTLDPDVMLTD